MENAIAPLPVDTAAAGAARSATGIAPLGAGAMTAMPAPTTALGRLGALPGKTLALLGVGLLALAVVVAAMLTVGRESPYKVLFANLSDKDGGAIIAQLSQMGVPYKHTEGGSAILVPADKVHDARLKLASQGLPKGGIVGLELMDSARFGQTQFQERLTFQRGLEGELTRSIMSLGSVQAARVHLALPQQNGFFREQQKPSASVLLTLHPGRVLDRAQVAGIVHLVSSSVPELNPKAVSVIDQTGALLSGSPEGDSTRGLDAQQLQYVQQLEATYLKRVIEILEPVVGKDNLRATVTAEVDFTQSESTSEQFRPNQGTEPATVRSQQLSESSTTNGAGNNPPAGVPGAATSQPPAPAQAPTTVQTNGQPAAPAAPPVPTSVRKDNVVNFEVDKTVRVTRNATGTVRRVNAAVVLNHRSSTDPKGKPVSTPLAPEELEKLTALVQESIGFSKDRGDSVKVINAPFHVTPAAPVEEVPLWKQPEVIDLVRTLALPVGLTLLGLLVIFGLIRPALKAAQPPEITPLTPLPGTPGAPGMAGGNLDATVGDDPALALPGGEAVAALADGSAGSLGGFGPGPSQQLDMARKLARENPAAVANIVRGWINGDEASA